MTHSWREVAEGTEVTSPKIVSIEVKLRLLKALEYDCRDTK